jgi:hypothetical protein
MLPDLSLDPGVFLRPRKKPKGVAFERDQNGFVLTASTAHLTGIFLLLFGLAWSLGGSIFVGFLFIFTLSTSPLLAFLPLALLGLVVYIGFQFSREALMGLCGKIEIRVMGNNGRVFAGIGSYGKTITFSWDEVHSVYVSRGHWADPKGYRRGIVLVGRERVKFFGTWPLNIERRDFLVHALATMLVK